MVNNLAQNNRRERTSNYYIGLYLCRRVICQYMIGINNKSVLLVYILELNKLDIHPGDEKCEIFKFQFEAP